MQLAGKQYLIIGANGAIGRLMTHALVQRGAGVIGTAKTNESAANLPEQLKQKLLLDLESIESINTFVDYLNSADAQIDGIINTAGRVGFGSIAETTSEDAHRLMQINHFGPSQVFTALLPQLAK